MVDNLVFLIAGVLGGFVSATILGHLHNRQLVHLAKMKIMADTGRDPLLVDAMAQQPDVVPAPKKLDGIEDLNKKIKETYGSDDLEVM